MKKEEYHFSFEVFDSIADLNEADAFLLSEARSVTQFAYAPYSNFQVGAFAKLVNGESVSGTNQENASYPVGLCAERALMAAASSLYPGVGIETMAISYNNLKGKSEHPASPCGMCRQYLVEFQDRTHQPIRLILSGMSGPVQIISTAKYLLPLGFSSTDLK